MSSKQKTAADAGSPKAGATAGAPALPATQHATGQKSSKERGSATRSKKNPGKRPHQGGSSA